MALVKDAALVLRRLDYSETSQVLAILTRNHGPQRLIAKGVKRATKKGGGHAIDLLELGEVVFSLRPDKDGTLAVLTEWHQQETFPHLRLDLPRCYAAQYAADVTAQLTEAHDPHPGLFDGLSALLLALADQTPPLALVQYLWLLLREIGLRPDLNHCVNCHQPVGGPGPLYFSSREGGAVCRDCEPSVIEKRRITPAAVRLLNNATAAPFAETACAHPDNAAHARPGDHAHPHRDDLTTTMQAFELLDYHLTEIMSHPPKVGPLFRAAVTHRA